MKQRCYNPKCSTYKYYGEKGVTVCEEWRNSFILFIKDMSKRPGIEYSIDRVDVYGNYCPENCRWATKSEQVNNTRKTIRILYKNREMTLSDLSEITGISRKIISTRYSQGWSIEKIINQKIGRNNRSEKEENVIKPNIESVETVEVFSISREVLNEIFE